ncbi:acyl-CoA dehydrogenase family protein [Chloroflexota bacterium]
MNFELEYTKEQEEFRREVREWLEKNIPEGLVQSVNSEDQSHERYQNQRELGRRLGAKGWLRPMHPKEYGGGEMSLGKAIIIEEEMDRYDLTLPPYYDSGASFGGASILVWGTEEQKKVFLPPICRGEVRSWLLETEPEAGSDLANVQTLAVRDRDEYVINGHKTFIGSSHGADWFWLICRTDPKAPRHENLSCFIFPSDLPGITIQPMDLFAVGGEAGAGSGIKNNIYLDNVRVPAFNLIGGENQGWKVAQASLELQHGGGGRITRLKLVDHLFDYCRNAKRNGKPLSKDPHVRDLLVEVYTEAEILRLFGLRNFWLTWAHRPRSYEGSQFSYYRKTAGPRMALAIQRILGPYSLANDPQWSPADGELELHQKRSIVALHGGGTTDIQKIKMSRRIGIGRAVKEEAKKVA